MNSIGLFLISTLVTGIGCGTAARAAELVGRNGDQTNALYCTGPSYANGTGSWRDFAEAAILPLLASFANRRKMI
jgi:hypothetical protein